MKYNLTLITPPAVEPITTAQAISYGRLGTLDAGETAFLTGLIVAAREYCEEKQNRAYITQTWQMSLCGWPEVIEISKGKLKTVTSVKYTDSAGVVHTLTPNTDYIVSNRGIVGRIIPPYGCYWPTAVLYPLDPIVIEFICGYGDAGANIPLKVIQSIYMLVAYWWDNRPATKLSEEVEAAVNNLLSLNRISNM